VTQEEQQDTHEGDTLADPAAASVDAEGALPGSAPIEAPGAGETAAHATDVPLMAEPAPAEPIGGASWEQSPSAADERGAAQREDPPIIPIVGAFVGAFVGAKLLGKLSGDDD
jgi:hypothetical protein